MKYKVELEFEVHAYGEDKELSEKELISKAKYAMDRGIYKWSDLICDTIGFPGDMDVKSVSIVNKEPVSESLEKASTKYAQDKYMPVQTSQAFKAGAKWQFERAKEALLSEVLPCFMHGGEADEVVAMLDYKIMKDE